MRFEDAMERTKKDSLWSTDTRGGRAQRSVRAGAVRAGAKCVVPACGCGGGRRRGEDAARCVRKDAHRVARVRLVMREEGDVRHRKRALDGEPACHVAPQVGEDVLDLALELVVRGLRAERPEDDEPQADECLEQLARAVPVLAQQPTHLLAV